MTNLTDALLAWYDARRRDLPWRRTRDPYAVWVSEIMLQQTRVATALPYYETFLERFPTVHDLADAEVDEVLALWSGLGYYRRARQMHAAARQVARSGGTFPRTSEGLRQLPGIGPYTAAAVASICFDEPIPVLDGNVERVLARRLALEDDVKRAAPRRRLVRAAAELLDPERPGDSNQALMELGATVCTPSSPDCSACPLAPGCRGRGAPESYPVPRRKRDTVEVTRVVAVVRAENDRAGGDTLGSDTLGSDTVLLFRRADDDGQMAGLWELPQVEVWRSESPEATSEPDPAEVGAALAERYGGRWTLGEEICRVRHSITHHAITLRVHAARLRDEVLPGRTEPDEAQGDETSPAAAWVDWRTDADRYATSSMVSKILSAYRQALVRDRFGKEGA